MTNRKLAYIVKYQKPLLLGLNETVQHACRLMWEQRTGSVLIVDTEQHLIGIFTGRDAVRLLGKGGDAATTRLAQVMTPNPVTGTPEGRAIDAMRAMRDGDFRHVPVTENGRILGVVSRGDFEGMEFEEFNWDGFYTATGIMANRQIASIVQSQEPLAFFFDETVQRACQAMSESRSGSVLVVDIQRRLIGIFTGRDAVRLLADGKDAGKELLGHAMTPDPMTIAPNSHAVDALRTMSDGGFRHLPVVEGERIYGIVSRNDFTGMEMDRLDEDVHLAECIW
jgi:CBS domain-containing protein